MKFRSGLCGFAVISLFAGAAHADATAKQFLQLYSSQDGADIAAVRITAVERGLFEMNDFVKINGGKPAYCQPPLLALTGPQLGDMLMRGVKADETLGDAELPHALLMVLRKTFPCAEEVPAHP